MPPSAGSLLKLMTSTTAARISTIALDVAGTACVVPGPRLPAGERYVTQYLSRQATSIAGGSNEMQRNMISERLLGMPKEPSSDRDRPFREVRRNTLPSRRS
jgi:alkylation response protein AidB-like acyl-CoA dehydrogenase